MSSSHCRNSSLSLHRSMASCQPCISLAHCGCSCAPSRACVALVRALAAASLAFSASLPAFTARVFACVAASRACASAASCSWSLSRSTSSFSSLVFKSASSRDSSASRSASSDVFFSTTTGVSCRPCAMGSTHASISAAMVVTATCFMVLYLQVGLVSQRKRTAKRLESSNRPKRPRPGSADEAKRRRAVSKSVWR